MTASSVPMNDPVYAPNPPEHVHGGRRIVLLGARALSYLVYAYVVFVEIILGFGFFFLLFGANQSSSFVDWVYRSLDRAMAPFRGMFTPIELGTTQGNVASVFDTSILFAMIVYGLLGVLVGGLIEWMSSRLARLDREDAEAQRRDEYAQYTGTATPGTPTGDPATG